MENFDIICTATLRPELLQRTFDTHIQYLFGDHIKKARLVINIDKVGSDQPDKAVNDILRFVDQIPFADIQINVCETPHFSRAFCWLLGQIYNPLTFNLEEDWEMTQPIDFERMVELFKEQGNLAHLRLSMFKSFRDPDRGHRHAMKTWNKFCFWNGEYFEVPKNLRGTIGWCGHPSLNRSSFLMSWGTILDPERNHEKQIKGAHIWLLRSRFGVFHPKETDPAIKDIGREWMTQNGYEKKGIKAFFTEWEKAK